MEVSEAGYIQLFNNFMSEPPTCFGNLPKELKLIILRKSDLDLGSVLRLQATSKEFRDLVWNSLQHLRAVELTTLGHENLHINIISRLNPFVVQTLDLRVKNPIFKFNNDMCLMLERFPALQQLRVDYTERDGWISLLQKHPSIIEVGYTSIRYMEDHDDIKEAIKYTRVVIETQNSLGSTLREPTYNVFDTNPAPFEQMDPFVLDPAKKFTCGGFFGPNHFMVGAKDGTVLQLRMNETKTKFCIESVFNGHKGETFISLGNHSRSFISSVDGVVTVWNVDHEPTLIKTLHFPEAIYVVSETNEDCKHILAAGKRTLYVCEFEEQKIVNTITLDEDITGLSSFRAHGVTISTTSHTQVCTGNSLVNWPRIDHWKTTDTPNFLLTPDGSLRITTTAKGAHIYDNVPDSLMFTLPGSYDSRPNTVRFNPICYWVTLSTGPMLVTYELEMKQDIMIVSPRVSKSVIRERKFPICDALWYHPDGMCFFGLFSDNTIYWWRSRN